jgi:hypothetical protein
MRTGATGLSLFAQARMSRQEPVRLASFAMSAGQNARHDARTGETVLAAVTFEEHSYGKSVRIGAKYQAPDSQHALTLYRT